MDTFLLKDIDSPIQGIYLSSEMIDLLSIIQCTNFEELKEFVSNCSQLNIDKNLLENWDKSDLDNMKKYVFRRYQESFISTKQSTKDRKLVFEKTLLNAGLAQEDVDRYSDVFTKLGPDGVKEILEREHPDEYAQIAKKQHECITSERDQIRSVSYEEMKKINELLPNSNTILVGSGRYYDVTNKLYTPNVDMEKYDFYHVQRGLDFCKENGMNARYHTLLDKQTMEDVMKGKSKDEIISELKSYVKESIDFINNYNKENKLPNGKPVISSVDLFNEIVSFDKLNENGEVDKENGEYKNMWQEKYGISLQDLADIFQYANENKPEGVTYVYNEPFLEDDERRKAVIGTLKEINSISPGLIDTLGSQMHIEMTQDSSEIKREFQDLKKLQDEGYNIQITEFDMSMPERFLFDEKGKARSEHELVNFINSKLSKRGVAIENIAELKSKRMDKISQIIKDSGVQLEGVSYWLVSDTLDHNVQRTNQKTWKNGLSRDVVKTRWAGMISSERELLKSKNKQDEKSNSEGKKQMMFSEEEIGKDVLREATTEEKDTAQKVVDNGLLSIKSKNEQSRNL